MFMKHFQTLPTFPIPFKLDEVNYIILCMKKHNIYMKTGVVAMVTLPYRQINLLCIETYMRPADTRCV